MNKIGLISFNSLFVIGSMFLLSTCGDPTTPDDTKYLKEFHAVNSVHADNQLDAGKLALYVDYSKCIADGHNSQFFNDITAPLTNKVTDYYSIKGDEIRKESLTDSTAYTRLEHIDEVNFANLKNAAEQIAKGNVESVLLTDGELYNKIDKSNDTNPYLADYFKIWLKKGHDIYIISEEYEENAKKDTLTKKRFYIIFTDSRIDGNIYESMMAACKDKIDEQHVFHLSADHPAVFSKDNASTPNPSLAAQVENCGLYEIQDWTVDWETIDQVIFNGVNSETGVPLVDGDYVITGLKLDRNTFGGYKITDVDIKVTDINEAYFDYYNSKEGGMKVGKSTIAMPSRPNFMKLDKKEFQKHGILKLHFDVQNYDDSFLDYGNPYNYFKIDFYVSKTENIIKNYKRMFVFPSISAGVTTNESVYKSVQQCLDDPDLKKQMCSTPFYTIYVKSNSK